MNDCTDQYKKAEESHAAVPLKCSKNTDESYKIAYVSGLGAKNQKKIIAEGNTVTHPTIQTEANCACFTLPT